MTIAFTTDGRTVAIAARDGLHLVDLHGRQPPRHVPCEEPYELAAVGGELWAALADQTLTRIRPDGTPRVLRKLWGGRGRLRPTAIGARGALWSEGPPAVIQDSGELHRMTVDADLVLPVSTTRWLVCRRDQVSLRDPGTPRWAASVAGGRIIDGCVLFEGRMAALVLASDDALVQLVVLSLQDGSLVHRLTLTGIDLVRFAPVRGYALLRAEDRKLLVFDLRFGQILAEHVEDRGFADAAIDPSGQTFLLRFGDAHDDVYVGPVRGLLAAPTPRAVEIEPTAPPTVEVAPLPPAPALAFHVGTEALRTTAPPTAIQESQHDRLERYRVAIAALAGLAIARAWDDGRISPALDGTLPFHTEVGGLLGAAQGRARAQVTDAAERLETALRAIDDTHSPMATLARRFGLTDDARLVLLAIAAPSLWGELARLYGILSNDEGRALVDELAVAQLLAPRIDRYAVAGALDADAPLLRYGIVRGARDRQRPFTALSVDPLVLRLLRGVDCEAELVDVRVERDPPPFADLLIPAHVKDDLARHLPAQRIVVRGRSGAGRHAILSAIAHANGTALGVIDATQLRGKRLPQLQAALQRTHLLGLLPCVDGLETHDGADRDELAQLLDEHPGPLAVRLPHDADPPLAPGYLCVDLPALSMDQRLEVWRILLVRHDLTVRDPAELADRFRVGPGAIATVCAETRVAADADAALALETAIRQHLAAKLRATATRVDKLASWSKVVLPPDIQESVLELIARIRRRRTVYDAWGMGEVITTARGVTALFSGGPGTGKTLVASAIAKELGMDLYRVDLSRIMSKWIGETEQNLAKLFDAAEDGHAIILFDEADSLFAKRTEVKSSVDRYANLEVNYLLQRLDTFEGIAILTTNFGTAIDSAFKRRLSFRLTFPFPDEDSREALWRAHLPPQLPRTGTFELAEVARKYQLSGGYIRNAALRAAFLAAEEQVPLSQHHLERAIRAEFREIGKIAESGVLE